MICNLVGCKASSIARTGIWVGGLGAKPPGKFLHHARYFGIENVSRFHANFSKQHHLLFLIRPISIQRLPCQNGLFDKFVKVFYKSPPSGKFLSKHPLLGLRMLFTIQCLHAPSWKPWKFWSSSFGNILRTPTLTLAWRLNRALGDNRTSCFEEVTLSKHCIYQTLTVTFQLSRKNSHIPYLAIPDNFPLV